MVVHSRFAFSKIFEVPRNVLFAMFQHWRTLELDYSQLKQPEISQTFIRSFHHLHGSKNLVVEGRQSDCIVFQEQAIKY